MSNKDTVAAIYEAFGRGDIPFILQQMADDVEWEKWLDNSVQRADVPYLRYKKGVSGVAEFFSEVPALKITNFQVLSLMEGENRVAAEIFIESEFFTDEEIHLWIFNDAGKVAEFRHYVDTAKHIAAAEKRAKSIAA